jgi:O-antigen ligase
LWWNASELISASPIVGWGNEWLPRWRRAKYGSIKYDLIHNGYLEILVRYGLVGALVFSILVASFVTSVHRASRRRLVSPSAFYAYVTVLIFFGLTLLSNSNNRLAIGESLALVSSAFACACRLLDDDNKELQR